MDAIVSKSHASLKRDRKHEKKKAWKPVPRHSRLEKWELIQAPLSLADSIIYADQIEEGSQPSRHRFRVRPSWLVNSEMEEARRAKEREPMKRTAMQEPKPATAELSDMEMFDALDRDG